MEIEDSKYEAMVSAKAEADSKLSEATTKLEDFTRRIEALEADKVKAEEEREAARAEAETAKEAQRVAAMREERLSSLGTGFRAKLDKLETTSKNVAAQAAKLADEEWEARLAELEESLGVKRDAKLDDKSGASDETKDTTAGLLFDRQEVARSGLLGSESNEVTAGEGEPSLERRQSVMSGLVRKKEKARA